MTLRSNKTLWLACLGAGILYGIFNLLSGKIHPPGCSFVEFRPQVSLPIFMGIVYGPAAGFVVGCFGDGLGYAFQGLGIFHAWNWSVGNGLIGMIPGFASYLGVKRIRSIKGFMIMMLLIVLATSLPIVFAAALDVLKSSMSFHDTLYTLILPAFITDAIFGFLIVPVMLYFAERLAITVETRIMLMITYPLILAVLITYTAGTFSMAGEGMSDENMVRALYNVGLLSLFVLCVGLNVSALLARKFTKPVVCLTDAAASIAKGDYEPDSCLKETLGRDDEIGQLVDVFQEMAQEVYAREQRLKDEVRELKIEIDKTKQAREVAKITGTDYFQQLRQKAKKLRIEE